MSAAALAVAASPVLSIPVTAHAQAAPADCPAPYPIAQVRDGMTGWGLTVSKGTAPERFTVRVQGVLKDGIAPGVDMILAEADSPALDKAGAIWAGMSGSPVYAPDGRLLGAVGYGFSGTSKLAGITPAKAMYDLLSKPDAVAAAQAAKKRVKLPAALQRTLTSRGLVDAETASAGLSRLPMPVGISGLAQRRIDALNKAAERQGAEVRFYRAGATGGAEGRPGAIVPGGNFGVLGSYGAVTGGGMGTVTAICDGKALAFGHSAFWTGATRLIATDGHALAVVPDPVFGAFKLANFGDVAGTLTQDRLTGIVAELGAGPAVTPVVSRTTAGGRTRTDTTYFANGEEAPAIAGLHLMSALDLARDRFAGGSVTATWTVRGTVAGKPWEITLPNRYSDRTDVSEAAGLESAALIGVLADSPYAGVRLTDLRLNVTDRGEYGRYTVAKLLVKRNGKWTALKPGGVLRATAGRQVKVRIRLTAARSPVKTVALTFKVPKKAKGTTGRLSVKGGLAPAEEGFECYLNPEECGEQIAAGSFADLLKKLKAKPRNDHLVGRLVLGSGKSKVVVGNRRLLDKIVGGEISLRVRVR